MDRRVKSIPFVFFVLSLPFINDKGKDTNTTNLKGELTIKMGKKGKNKKAPIITNNSRMSSICF